MNVDTVLAWPFADVLQTYTREDTILYALGVGFGADPVDSRQLRYVYEKSLLAVPSMATVLGHPGPWGEHPATGIDLPKVVYAEQSCDFHAVLPPAATIRAQERVTGLVDKGRDKGALLTLDRRIVDDETGIPLATLRATLLCRGDSGFGTSHGVASKTHELPGEAPHRVVELPTLPQQALLYRLNGDLNPLHVDPETAKRVGFERPILHGLCSFGFAVHALLALYCGYDAARLKHVSARFSAPMIPGETFVFESWRKGNTLSFRAWSKQRQVTVLNHGHALVETDV
jgi:acyl dehydratase